jgi:hypothetical protein
MKNVIITCGILITICFLSCAKKVKVVDTGGIRYVNTSNAGNRYEMFLDGTSLGLINANTVFEKANIEIGSHAVKAVQIDGVILVPITISRTVTVSKGLNIEFSFP